jgi:integrase
LLSPFGVKDGFLHLRAEQTKTAWPRSVPLTERAAEILARFGLATVTRGRVRSRWEKAVRDLELPQGTVFRSLRHATATRLIEKGVNLGVVQEYLGHNSIATTIGYTHPDKNTLAEAAKALAAK